MAFMKRFGFACLILGLGPAGLLAQVTGFEDDFETDDPCITDWVCRDATRWVPPDADPCDPQFASIDDATLPQCNIFDPAEGYVLVTPAVNGRLGSMWRSEKIEYNNFKLTAEIEMNGGGAPPADGMTIVVVGGDDGRGGHGLDGARRIPAHDLRVRQLELQRERPGE